MAPDSHFGTIKLVTDPLDDVNFTTWRFKIQNALAFQNLDDYILSDTEAMKKKDDYAACKKLATTFIRMHLSDNCVARFVGSDLTTYEPKQLWDSILNFYATKSLENAASLWDKLHDIHFVDDNIKEALNTFRSTFQLLVEVTTGKLDKKTLETCWIFFLLKRLPPSFSIFRSLKFAQLKTSEISLNSFLTDVEDELRRQGELAKQNELAETANLSGAALLVSTQAKMSGKQSSSRRMRQRCENGVHNPATNHSEEDCHAAHPEKAAAFHQAALEKANSRIANKAMLSVNCGIVDSIILDSGATGHYLAHKSYFKTLRPHSSQVYAANGSAIPIVGEGPAIIHTASGPITISKAYYVPELSNSLIPLTHYLQQGYSLLPTRGGSSFELRKENQLLCSGSTQANLLTLELARPQALMTTSDALVLHNSLGHPSLPYLKAAFPDLNIKDLNCAHCDVAKMHRQPFSGNFPQPLRALECIHMDLCGPITPASRGGNKYFLKIIDGHSKYRFIYPMPSKSHCFIHFNTFLTTAENSSGRKLQSVVTDNGGEFVNAQFKALFNARGVTHHITAPYTPQQNPFAERGNRTTVEKVRAMLLTAGLGLQWWGEAVSAAVHLENRSPDSSIKMRSPYELWTGKPPDLSRLHPFGCRAVVYQQRHNRLSKFSPSGLEAILIGYAEAHKSYKLWVPSTKSITISHHVKFFPQEFPFRHLELTDTSPQMLTVEEETLFDLPISKKQDDNNIEEVPPVNTPPPSPLEERSAQNAPSPATPSQHFDTASEGQDEPPLGIPVTTAKGYTYVPYFTDAPRNISSSVDPSNIIEGSRRHRACVIVGEPASLKDPRTYAEAMRRLDKDEWLMAVEVEINNITRHEVWVVSPMKAGTRQLDTVWVFKRKYNADGDLLKFKARLCVRGFRQIEGIDYNDTFAPTGRLVTLRVLLGMAAALDFEIEQMDVRCAFLNGIPDEDIFIKVPEGVNIDVPPGHGLKLQKSLYGLKQSPRCWYQSLKEFFASVNFIPSVSDACLFIHQDPARPVFVFVHVDDLVIVGPDVSFLKAAIKQRFEMEDLGPCQWLLGMRVSRDRQAKTISLCQDRYIGEILEEFRMQEAKTASTPLPLNAITAPVDSRPVSSFFNYRRAVGLINYLVQCTRPDLAFACSYLSQFLNNPSITHEQQVKHVFRYLRKTQNLRLRLGQPPSIPGRIIAFADSSHESAKESASFSGSLLHYYGAVGWRAQKQADDGPSLSTTEAEYRACSESGQDIRWLEQLLADINPRLNLPLPSAHLYCDNQGALALLKNPQYSHRVRHIDVRHHWLRFHIAVAKNFSLSYVKTDENQADFLTKPLSPMKTREAIGYTSLVVA